MTGDDERREREKREARAKRRDRTRAVLPAIRGGEGEGSPLSLPQEKTQFSPSKSSSRRYDRAHSATWTARVVCPTRRCIGRKGKVWKGVGGGAALTVLADGKHGVGVKVGAWRGKVPGFSSELGHVENAS
ncbi:hypothetical protein J6590_052326 [Homalodisca vitripennis]|nr:hypothetical protein J6590_052326 [Homalodisca vitripennis]